MPCPLLWVFLACAEMVPLLPTQPLYLSAGLLFGAPNGIFPARPPGFIDQGGAADGDVMMWFCFHNGGNETGVQQFSDSRRRRGTP